MKAEEIPERSCACETCKRACEAKPGSFLPGEAEKVADSLGLSLRQLFDERLSIDWQMREDGSDCFALAPATPDVLAEVWPGRQELGLGRCTFLDGEGRCTIYALRPAECRAYFHDEPPSARAVHATISKAWDTPEHQGQIKELLGFTPSVPESDLWGGLFGSWSDDE